MGPICKAFAIGALVAAGTACTASGEDVRPEPDQLFYPTGAAASPDGSRLFVANANSDLTYGTGALTVVRLAKVNEVADAWLAQQAIPGESCGEGGDSGPCCEQDADFTETLVCDESLFIDGDAGVRIGNFATDIAVQGLDNGALRLVVPTRGDPSITWVDWLPAEQRLSCSASGERFGECDDMHRLTGVVEGDTEIAAILEEPFGVFADTAGQFAMVTHLTSSGGRSGAVTLIDSPRDGAARVTDMELGLFEIDSTTGLGGATGVAGRNPNAENDIIYVGSRTDDRIQTFTVGRPFNGLPPFLLAGPGFNLDAVGSETNNNNRSNDTRGMVFSASGDRLYLLNRKPPSLQIYDTSIGARGVPVNQAVGATDICRQASAVAVADAGDGERVYLTCFQDGQVYVIDPRGRGRIEDIITVGRGPFALAAAPDGRRLYVTNFLEDTISVIDLVPTSPTRNRVVLRLGEPRPL